MIYIVYFYLMWSSIAEYFIKAGVPIVSSIDELLAFVLLVHLIVVKTNGDRPSAPFTKRIWIILGVSVLSMIVNFATPVGALLFIFSIMKSIVLFYWIKKFIRDDRLMIFTVRYLVFLILLQIPFFIFGLATSGLAGYSGDNATGAIITGNAFQVAIYMWLGVILNIAMYFTSKEKKYLIFLGVCFFILLITSTKQVAIILPFVIIFLLRQQLRLTIRKIAIFASILIVIGFALFNYVETVWVREWGVEHDDDDYYAAIEGSEKIQGYYSAIYELPDELPIPLLGAGPGQYGSYVGMAARTPLSEKYIMYYNDLIPEGYGGTLTYRSSGLIGIYGDIGILGLIIFLSIYISAIKISTTFSKLTTSPFDSTIAFLATASGILIIAESLFQNIFEGNWFILNYFWILSGCIFVKPTLKK